MYFTKLPMVDTQLHGMQIAHQEKAMGTVQLNVMEYN